jgi:hypothetical protein
MLRTHGKKLIRVSKELDKEMDVEEKAGPALDLGRKGVRHGIVPCLSLESGV